MTAAVLLAALLWTAASVAAGLTLGAGIAYANRAQAEPEPWLYGDEAWIADQPFEVLSRDEQVKRLETWL